ncbi:MAG: cytochrome c, partial [Deltaproteobacteria bacterium]
LWLSTGCDLGGGGGGGPETVVPGRRPLPARATPISDPVARGKALYERMGCALCHGEEGSGGVANPNSETGGKIVGLTLVKEGYSEAELVAKIGTGVPNVGRKDPGKAPPPLRMPAYATWLSEEERHDLAAYLFSLYPKDRESEDDWDE